MKDRPGYEILSLGVTEDSVPAALALVISLVDLHVVLECQEYELLFALCLEQIYGSLLPACGRPGFHTPYRHASLTPVAFASCTCYLHSPYPGTSRLALSLSAVLTL